MFTIDSRLVKGFSGRSRNSYKVPIGCSPDVHRMSTFSTKLVVLRGARTAAGRRTGFDWWGRDRVRLPEPAGLGVLPRPGIRAGAKGIGFGATHGIHVPFVMGFGTREILGNGATWSNYWLLLFANFAVGLFVSLAIIREVEQFSPWLSGWLFGSRAEPRTRTPGDGVNRRRRRPHEARVAEQERVDESLPPTSPPAMGRRFQ